VVTAYELVITADQAGQRLDRLVRKLFAELPRGAVFKLIRTGGVRVNGKRAQPEQSLCPGDRLSLARPPTRLASVSEPAVVATRSVISAPALVVLYEDDELLVLDKPFGLAVHAGTGIVGPTLVDLLLRDYRPAERNGPLAFQPAPAHRLDRDTSGVLVVAKKRQAMVRLAEQFRVDHAVIKRYVAVVSGSFPEAQVTLDATLERRDERRGTNAVQTAVTHVRRLGATLQASLLALTIETGRSHQIRRHLVATGHPVLLDRRYGDPRANSWAERNLGLQRMALHAHRAQFRHPIRGNWMKVVAPLPQELKIGVERLGLMWAEEMDAND